MAHASIPEHIKHINEHVKSAGEVHLVRKGQDAIKHCREAINWLESMISAIEQEARK